MKQLWLHLVETYLRIGFFFYYKDFKAHYKEEIPKDKAILFLSNHQNALLDPLLITIKTNKKNYFLTRANVFSSPIVAKFLKSLQMLPVYRMRDGIKTILKNKDIFAYCVNLLQNKKSIILFPEGSHSIARRVRPLSKGFTRIVDENFKNNANASLAIVPVGLNFQTLTEYGDSVSVYFGKSIDASLFFKEGETDVIGLKKEVSNALQSLTTHINLENYEETLSKLEQLQVDFTNPQAVNTCIHTNLKYTSKTIKKPGIVYYIFKALTAIVHFFSYLIWKKIVFPKIKEPEFIGTFRFVVVAFVAPIFLLLEALLVIKFLGATTAIFFLLAAILFPLIALRLK